MTGPDGASAAARWELIQELFADALELSPDERSVLLDRRCGDDDELRGEVESLLGAAAESDDYFGDLAGRAGMTLSTLTESGDGEGPSAIGRARAADPNPDLIGRRIGQYEVREWLGQGGMASVYLAERKGEGFTQRVALKLVSRRFSDPLIQRRSNEERRILARLEHRNIARLIDGGLTPEGYPFYAMEYVEGTDVLRFCDDRKLTVKERLELFLEVCAPVQFAHERLIVHCDLKPSNIFVTDAGHVKLLDFGVARLIDPDSAGDEVTGLWFTPAYASPEQVRRERPGTASDVYSLGILLYEILTGHRPYRFSARSHAVVAETVNSVVPQPPSAVVTQPSLQTRAGAKVEVPAETLAHARASTPDRMKKRLRGDLDAIVMKALAKDPEERYRTAEQMASDVRRHLDHRLLSSVQHTQRYRVSKFVRRNRTVVFGAGLVLTTLTAGVGATLWQAARATRAAAVARDEAEKAELVASLMTEMFRLSDPNEVLGDTITARDLLDRGTERIQSEFGDQPVVQAQLLSEVATVYRNLGLFRRAEPLVRQALELRIAEFGVGSLEASETLIQMGSLEADLGRQADAIQTLSRGIDVRTPLVDFPDPLLIQAQGRLGWLVRSAQEYDRAADLFTAALEGQRVLDPDGAGVADMMFGLAAAYHDTGLLDQADSLLRTVLSDLDADARPTPMAVGALVNVGMIRRLREEYRDAEPILRRAADMAGRLYGSSHLQVFEAKQELGIALAGTGKWDEAERILRETLHGSAVLLGPQHEMTANTQEALGTLLADRLEFDEAVSLHQASLEEKVLRHQNRDHPGVVSSLVKVAEALAGAGRFEEARDYITQAESMNRRMGSDRSVYSISSERTLGTIAMHEGDYEAAEGHYAEAITLAEELLARPDHRYTLWAKVDYGVFLARVGRHAEGVALLEEVLERQIANLGESHPSVDRTRALIDGARDG